MTHGPYEIHSMEVIIPRWPSEVTEIIWVDMHSCVQGCFAGLPSLQSTRLIHCTERKITLLTRAARGLFLCKQACYCNFAEWDSMTLQWSVYSMILSRDVTDQYHFKARKLACRPLGQKASRDCQSLISEEWFTLAASSHFIWHCWSQLRSRLFWGSSARSASASVVTRAQGSKFTSEV